jgi:hypothetical protein
MSRRWRGPHVRRGRFQYVPPAQQTAQAPPQAPAFVEGQRPRALRLRRGRLFPTPPPPAAPVVPAAVPGFIRRVTVRLVQGRRRADFDPPWLTPVAPVRPPSARRRSLPAQRGHYIWTPPTAAPTPPSTVPQMLRPRLRALFARRGEFVWTPPQTAAPAAPPWTPGTVYPEPSASRRRTSRHLSARAARRHGPGVSIGCRTAAGPPAHPADVPPPRPVHLDAPARSRAHTTARAARIPVRTSPTPPARATQRLLHPHTRPSRSGTVRAGAVQAAGTPRDPSTPRRVRQDRARLAQTRCTRMGARVAVAAGNPRGGGTTGPDSRPRSSAGTGGGVARAAPPAAPAAPAGHPQRGVHHHRTGRGQDGQQAAPLFHVIALNARWSAEDSPGRWQAQLIGPHWAATDRPGRWQPQLTGTRWRANN